MGCNSCTPKDIQENPILFNIKSSLQDDDPSLLRILLYSYCNKLKKTIPDIIDQRFLQLGELKLSPLSYSVSLGSSLCFFYLSKKLHASFKLMEENLEQEKQPALSTICKYGYLELLKEYLPFYIIYSNTKKSKVVDSYTLNFTSSLRSEEDTILPIHVACIAGHLHIVRYIGEYFKDEKEKTPPELDLHYIDEVTGENCALISARTGNFPLMKMLYEQFHVDFNVKNKRNENALQIAAVYSKNTFALHYFECFMYLINVVGIDIVYMHEEILLTIEHPLLIGFYEGKLKEKGILVMKRDVESMFKIINYFPARQDDKEEVSMDFLEISRVIPSSSASDFQASPNLML